MIFASARYISTWGSCHSSSLSLVKKAFIEELIPCDETQFYHLIVAQEFYICVQSNIYKIKWFGKSLAKLYYFHSSCHN